MHAADASSPTIVGCSAAALIYAPIPFAFFDERSLEGLGDAVAGDVVGGFGAVVRGVGGAAIGNSTIGTPCLRLQPLTRPKPRGGPRAGAPPFIKPGACRTAIGHGPAAVKVDQRDRQERASQHNESRDYPEGLVQRVEELTEACDQNGSHLFDTKPSDGAGIGFVTSDRRSFLPRDPTHR